MRREKRNEEKEEDEDDVEEEEEEEEEELVKGGEGPSAAGAEFKELGARRMSATPRDPLRISNTSVPVTGQFQSVPPWYSVYVTIYSAYDPTIPRIVPPC
ncbi:hypothetical protein HZH66_002147 [Vespula vulgaris]|uniref:Uncharacterized protein n=1 Tax=Vespula vulgaris TaxID=7454 RepID=A0A834NEZ1_VESVU|nr:hypothetical protein HZH66_002147 [Vespula vulgaris]